MRIYENMIPQCLLVMDTFGVITIYNSVQITRLTLCVAGQGVHSTSRLCTSFGNYQSVGESSRFYIGMRIIKTKGRRSGPNIYMHQAVSGTDYVNAREMSCEMVLDPDPQGYTIVPTTYAPMQEAQFLLSVFTKASIILEPL